MSMTALLVLAVIVGVPVAGALILFGLGRLAATKNAAAAVLTAPGQVIGVREIAATSGSQHWVRFAFPDGNQREFQATASQAEVMVRGQHGTVYWIGERLTGWVPELGQGPQDVYRSDS